MSTVVIIPTAEKYYGFYFIYSLDKVDIVQRKQDFFGDSSSCQTLYNITQKYILVGVIADIEESIIYYLGDLRYIGVNRKNKT